MKLLTSSLLYKGQAKEVESFDQIKNDAEEMIMMLDNGVKINGKFVGALALHHSQVNTNPFNFFVINRHIKHFFDGRRIFVNPKIIDQRNLVPFEEGCMSFLDRPDIKTRRFEEISVTYQYPKSDGTLKFLQLFDLKEFPAFVFQHEFDHGCGKNIHDEFSEYNQSEVKRLTEVK